MLNLIDDIGGDTWCEETVRPKGEEGSTQGTTFGEMNGMTKAAKLKLSVTLSADVLALVDRDARRLRETRSGIIEQWLRRAAAGNVEREIEQATVAYYRFPRR